MEQLKHECGIAMIRLLKPLEYYHEKYGTWMYGLNKLYLLMEKQHNRGQEGAGLACVKLASAPGEEFMFRERAEGNGAITDIFSMVHEHFKDFSAKELADPFFCKEHVPFAGELYMGHLRYSTTGRSGLSYVHPFLRRNNWKSNNLALCGNFNLTNVDEVFHHITSSGQHPRQFADTFIILEQLGHRLDREVERIYSMLRKKDMKKGLELTQAIEDNIDLTRVLKSSSELWDGGYVICGLTGSGESFAFRDPWGIRPAFYYTDDEIVVVASERPVIQTAFNTPTEAVRELKAGEGILVGKHGSVQITQINEPKKFSACSFERIYFSRGSDRDIYRERKQLGENLIVPILQTVNGDFEHTVFSFIPNTAEVAFFGMIQGFEQHLNQQKRALIHEENGTLTSERLDEILSMCVRIEKVAIKDIKLRTFITESNSRNDLAAHVYDITYGSITPGIDNLVVIDDSIVRGTTLKQSIIKILDRLKPKKIVIVSSSPQIRYPDCYGIDMSRMDEFIAFKAAIALLKERNMQYIIDEVYNKSKAQQNNPKEEIVNYVKKIYAPFTDTEIAQKIAELLTPAEVKSKIEIVYQTLDGLYAACPNHPGDWYFSGNYPTPGGNRFVNNAFINYIEGANRN
ncbi:MAG: amidophosphoribosyltransferase [Bacteroidales bacterium]|nr:amidophosphoribosyltransferase [Bacteroidales bacterium]